MLPTISFVLVLTCTAIFNLLPTKANEIKTYIVHLTPPEGRTFSQPHDLEEWYNSYLYEIPSLSNDEKPMMVHAYHHVMIGFAAKMSAEQAKAMENLSGVVLVRPQSVLQLHTTRSPYFLGLHQNSAGFWKESNYGKGIIIGVVDTGITPGHPSYDDRGVPPPPARWKGKCEVAGCNNKLIGMRNFANGNSPIDDVGHGTHTSSTAAGSPVDNANVFGEANGTATGMAPLAHLAMYRVLGGINGSSDSDVMAGMDAAVGDGVDVISVSIGGTVSPPFYLDSIAISAFTAIQKGIFVSCSAGNYGPRMASLSNESPWILTVGASTIDRRIRTSVYLGNKKLIDGESLNQPKDFPQQLVPLVYPGETGGADAARCESLDHIDVKGKIVLCDMDVVDELVVKEAGGVAMILTNDIDSGETISAEPHVLPASEIGYKEGFEIKKYLTSTSSPLATILLRGTVLDIKSAPEVASFSSRGPNRASPGILKPDIIGPGVNILGAWRPKSIDNNAGTEEKFKVRSGTSMACPHLVGIAALLKSTHPEWSPAAIKSAIMTTASQVSLNGHAIVDNKRDNPADVFAIGSGHVNPSKANDPGLVFDIQPDDYIPYLCGLGYSPKQVAIIVKKHVSCSETILEAQLNYPSFAVTLRRGDSKTYSRTVTNVGLANSTYTIGSVTLPQGVGMVIDIPSQELSFKAVYQKLTYTVTFSRDSKDAVKGPYDQGHLTWVSGQYSVRTPFSFKFE